MREHTLGTATWIELDAPRTAELDALHTRFGVPELLVEVAGHDHHRPRVDRVDEHVVVVLKPASYRDPEEIVEIGQLVVVLGPDLLVTVGPLDERRRELASRPLAGPAEVLHALASDVVDAYTDVLDGLITDVDQIESAVFSPTRGSHAERIYRLKSEVQDFRRAVAPLAEQLDELVADDAPPDLRELEPDVRDVRTRAVRTAEHVAQLDDLLTSVLNAHLAQIAIQQNNDMRRISAWVAIVAAPTAMASIYGMNFDHMPELGWRYGYFVVLAAMVAVCTTLHRLFKRSGWL